VTKTARLTLASGLVVLAAAGCSSAASFSAAAPAVSAMKSLPAGCAEALMELPVSAPPTASQATADYNALGRGPNSTARGLANDVGEDSVKLEFDYTANLPTAADVSQWNEDAAALRKYCA
jgi:hypothetical protein